MSWVPPFFTCGECGGEIGRWPMQNLLKHDILDWRHRSVPPGTDEHRAVLGTPVPIAELVQAPEPAPVEEAPGIPDPEVPARPAMRDELPTAALRIDTLAAENSWRVEAWYMRGPWMSADWKMLRVVSSVVLRLERDGHRLVASWDQAMPGDKWTFDTAYSLGHTVEPLSGPEFKEAIRAVRAICETCHEPPALHVSTNAGPVCYREFHAEQGGTP